jgi:hypothetical protein
MKEWKILDNIDFLTNVKGPLLQKLLIVIAALVNYERKFLNKSW